MKVRLDYILIRERIRRGTWASYRLNTCRFPTVRMQCDRSGINKFRAQNRVTRFRVQVISERRSDPLRYALQVRKIVSKSKHFRRLFLYSLHMMNGQQPMSLPTTWISEFPFRPAWWFLHIAALVHLAAVQPVYSLLVKDDNATFFIAHQSTAGDIILLVAILSLLTPLAAFLVPGRPGHGNLYSADRPRPGGVGPPGADFRWRVRACHGLPVCRGAGLSQLCQCPVAHRRIVSGPFFVQRADSLHPGFAPC